MSKFQLIVSNTVFSLYQVNKVTKEQYKDNYIITLAPVNTEITVIQIFITTSGAKSRIN